jgi:two-component system cell cycle response regulator
MLPETPVAEAKHVAERVRNAVAEHDFVVEPEDAEPARHLRLTASVGVASLPEDADSPARLVEIADRALYQAKHQGRNRVVVADPTHRVPEVEPEG